MSIKVKNLSFKYKKNNVLKNINFEVLDGRFICVLGPNGVGKSTLFKCILGILQKYTGTILINDTNINNYSISQLAKEIAYVPQSHSPTFNYTVLEMVLMGTTSQLSRVSIPKKEQLAVALKSLEKVGMSKLINKGYTEISGGERQLVLIARALSQNARILIMDEPTANLDYGNQLRVLNEVKKLSNEGYTIIQSTHNPDQTFLFADDVLAIFNGEIIAYGNPWDIVNNKLVKKLYNVEIEVNKLYEDKVCVCVPKFAII